MTQPTPEFLAGWNAAIETAVLRVRHIFRSDTAYSDFGPLLERELYKLAPPSVSGAGPEGETR